MPDLRAFLCSALAMSAFAAPPALAACAEPRVDFAFAAVSRGDRDDFEAELRRSILRACEWWGDTFDGAFVVTIEDSRGPSMALVPAWRGERGAMLFRARPVRSRQAAIQHEVVHVFAPNANRMLAEGLAVYAHERLGAPSAYPNFGNDLHLAAKELPEIDMAALERIATPTPLQGTDERQAYIAAGSFVRFLIERHGFDAFRRLYALTPLVPRQRDAGEPGRWREVYGVELAALVAEWRAALGR
jgi:hypothetical protein